MEEHIDIVDINGKSTGVSAPKSEIHAKGHIHNTAHIWFYTSKGNILLQQRAASKTICPLLWDVSVAGHVGTGESIKQAAIRETREEIGAYITENDLKKIGIFKCFQSYPNGIIDNEFHHTFITKLKVDIQKLTLQKNEVEALKLVTIDQFRKLLKNSKKNSHFVDSNTPYYLFVLDTIKHVT